MIAVRVNLRLGRTVDGTLHGLAQRQIRRIASAAIAGCPTEASLNFDLGSFR
jgi:hypothetical protein